MQEIAQMDETKVIQVIYSNVLRRGKGTQDDPVRRVEQWFSLDGTLLFEKDPCHDNSGGRCTWCKCWRPKHMLDERSRCMVCPSEGAAPTPPSR